MELTNVVYGIEIDDQTNVLGQSDKLTRIDGEWLTPDGIEVMSDMIIVFDYNGETYTQLSNLVLYSSNGRRYDSLDHLLGLI